MYLAIEGCIGSGKTTVARLLCKTKNLSLILEEFEKNPFLDKFYLEPGKHDLETELAFVLIHYHQLKIIKDFPLENYLSDFYFGKDLLYAETNLFDNEIIIFKSLYFQLSTMIPEPDLIIGLQGSNDLIIDRILKRKQGKEIAINTDYFIKLNERYKEFFDDIQMPKIMVDMDDRDFLKDPDQITWLSNEIDKVFQSNL